MSPPTQAAPFAAVFHNFQELSLALLRYDTADFGPLNGRWALHSGSEVLAVADSRYSAELDRVGLGQGPHEGILRETKQYANPHGFTPLGPCDPRCRVEHEHHAGSDVLCAVYSGCQGCCHREVLERRSLELERRSSDEHEREERDQHGNPRDVSRPWLL
ncbi:hypothetical protein Q8F55_009232 [Vanrija albida]|uniref:Uncharacterized protein n=1 Tax=Vanrija albida TaxID=181172 RepID=A0ABR3PT27_9TREE